MSRFNIIHYAGEPVKAIDLHGHTVYRRDDLYLKDRGVLVRVAPYDNHFIYETETEGSAYMCTCGSPAVIVGADAYKADASPTTGFGIVQGELMVCLAHATNGVHADGSS